LNLGRIGPPVHVENLWLARSSLKETLGKKGGENFQQNWERCGRKIRKVSGRVWLGAEGKSRVRGWEGGGGALHVSCWLTDLSKGGKGEFASNAGKSGKKGVKKFKSEEPKEGGRVILKSHERSKRFARWGDGEVGKTLEFNMEMRKTEKGEKKKNKGNVW